MSAIVLVPTMDIEEWLMPVVVPPAKVNASVKGRIKRFAAWMRKRGYAWHSPNLAEWRDSLLAEGISPKSVVSYLGTIRARYKELVTDNNQTRAMLYNAIPEDWGPDNGDAWGPADRQAWVNELMHRLENDIKPSRSSVKVTKVQDVATETQLRLTKEQASALLAAPGMKRPLRLRDTAIIALLLCTGIREGELVALEVQDLRQHLGDELALSIQHGKGDKARLIPYGELSWCLAIVDKWLDAAGITEGPVFRGFEPGGKVLRSEPITTRAINKILRRYKIAVNGELVSPHPHDLRRTYARRLYEANVRIEAIQQNLGHSDVKTTQKYIGELGADLRRPPALYDFDLAALDSIKTQGKL